jgi:hypothetical protein
VGVSRPSRTLRVRSVPADAFLRRATRRVARSGSDGPRGSPRVAKSEPGFEADELQPAQRPAGASRTVSARFKFRETPWASLDLRDPSGVAQSRPTHVCEAHHVSDAEQQRGVANSDAPRECVPGFEPWKTQPGSAANGVSEQPGPSSSGSNPERRRGRLSTFANSPSSLSPGRRVARPNGVRSRRREQGAKRPVNALPSVVRGPTSRSHRRRCRPPTARGT